MSLCKALLDLTWLLPVLVLNGALLEAQASLPRAPLSAKGSDLGPPGLFTHLSGEDDSDTIVGIVSYNNQGDSTVHIEELDIYGDNVATLGRFQIHKAIQPGEKQQLLVILRAVPGKRPGSM